MAEPQISAARNPDAAQLHNVWSPNSYTMCDHQTPDIKGASPLRGLRGMAAEKEGSHLDRVHPLR